MVLPVELFASGMSNETVSTVKVGNVVPGFGRVGPSPAEETRAARAQGARVVRDDLHGTELAVSVHSFEPEAELKSKEVGWKFAEVISVRADPAGVDVEVPVNEPGFERLFALVPLLFKLGLDRVAVDVLPEELAVGVPDGLVPVKINGVNASAAILIWSLMSMVWCMASLALTRGAE